ncbi:CheY-P phosphatase CheX [Alicyclobacillus contaminans]|uniref:chemotaxis protein CheX n=1 Tax=Alicyclobacillus contaminans TaxID=392016 RepID=UPI00047C308F|nr:chemotaxis protein CheX [Alicyclobacillus contaminans]GMA51229.1 CheY-P phosphatase CheX [Alicyclobacillus contaminans]
MSTTYVTGLLNGMLSAVSTVIPIPARNEKPLLVDAPIMNVEMGVLIGLAGQIRGRFLLAGEPAVFGNVAEAMFGMRIEGEMLESFVGELGNMIGGTMCTNVSQDGVLLDITPPTVFVGDIKLSGFRHALSVPVELETKGILQLVLIVEEMP